MISTSDNGEAEVRAQVARELSQRDASDLAVVEGLIALLADGSPLVRRLAALGLADHGRDAARALAPLLPLLEDRDAQVRRAAAIALELLSETERPWVRYVLQIRAMKREPAAAGLLTDNACQWADFFAHALDDPNEQVRWYAALGIGACASGPAWCKDRLGHMLRDERTHMKVAGIVGVMGLNEAGVEFTAELQRLVAHENDVVRELAGTALAALNLGRGG